MSKFRIPVSYLPAFEAAARHESIKEAADELHVTHSAVSRNIRKLERFLGRALFDRRHRRITLTSEGEIMLAGVDGGFSHIQQAIAHIAVRRSPQRLVISVDADFAALWLVPRLRDFQASQPNVLIDIRAESVKRGTGDARMDCAIHYFEAGAPPENGEILFRSRLFPVCAPELLRRSTLEALDDLRNHTLIFDRSKLEWQQLFSEAGIKMDVSRGMVFYQTTLCMESAARGQGVALGDDFLAEMYLSEGRLVKVLDSGFLSRNAYYFIVAKGLAAHPTVSAFRKWLLRGISQVRNGGTRRLT